MSDTRDHLQESEWHAMNSSMGRHQHFDGFHGYGVHYLTNDIQIIMKYNKNGRNLADEAA